jgi:ribosome-associated protein
MARRCCFIVQLVAVVIAMAVASVTAAWIPSSPMASSSSRQRPAAFRVFVEPPQQRQQQQRRQPSNQQTQQDMIRFMEQPVAARTTITAQDVLVDDATMALVECIVRAADGRKGEQIAAWIVQHVTTLTSVLVVVSGNSRPQNQAIGNAIGQAVLDANLLPRQPSSSSSSSSTSSSSKAAHQTGPMIEGTAESGWMLIDYGSVMVHIMTPKSRLFYNVEGRWRDSAVPIDLSAMLVPNSGAPPPSSSSSATIDTMEPTREDDPFWS